MAEIGITLRNDKILIANFGQTNIFEWGQGRRVKDKEEIRFDKTS